MLRQFDSEYFSSVADLPGTDIAGITMFDALIDALRSAEANNGLSARKKRVVLRQIAIQAEQIAYLHNLDHNIDFRAYTVAKEAA